MSQKREAKEQDKAATMSLSSRTFRMRRRALAARTTRKMRMPLRTLWLYKIDSTSTTWDSRRMQSRAFHRHWRPTKKWQRSMYIRRPKSRKKRTAKASPPHQPHGGLRSPRHMASVASSVSTIIKMVYKMASEVDTLFMRRASPHLSHLGAELRPHMFGLSATLCGNNQPSIPRFFPGVIDLASSGTSSNEAACRAKGELVDRIGVRTR
mmetsp:Transcript_75206/g.207466  ORF Transcript_75206/g.207466 Transcript_75206/m.207466 type:complete len:209 (-) Transcript_75206:202-828(-)